MKDGEVKGMKARARRKAYIAHLDERIPKLMEQGYQGRSARVQADREWAQR